MRNLLKLFMVFCLTFAFTQTIFAQNDDETILGQWKTIDDETGKPKSIVNLYIENGKLYGKIVKLFREEGEDPDPVCDKCEGEYKNKKIIGMVIINGLTKEDNVWTNGKILDPEKGKWYRTKIWEEDGKLQVRGYVAFFHRTQEWVRPTKEEMFKGEL
ncbi:MAG: DUF2147 domain-containing protein [Deferribacterota bacterium]|nr:DUF2147 domain-containing protein [Deferribacterota bacterium]